jgi:hypothetical protein
MPMMMTKTDSPFAQLTAEAGKSLMPTKPVFRLLGLPRFGQTSTKDYWSTTSTGMKGDFGSQVAYRLLGRDLRAAASRLLTNSQRSSSHTL